jgi:hypothetical protein
MRIYKVLFFLPLLFLLSCKSKVPAGILGSEEMKSLLIDIHIVDGQLASVPATPDSLFKHSASFYQQVFEQHHTDSTQFAKSFNYYTNQPDQMFEIYDGVYNVIKVKADSAVKVNTKKDSLERARQAKLAAQLAKRTADSVKRVNKARADSILKKKTRADAADRAKKLRKK